jgi:hypothetical protein
MHQRSTQILFVVVLLALVVAPVAAVGASWFEDVPEGHTFKADIDWLASAGVTKGCNPPVNDTFCPDSYVTRAQMAAFMHRLAVNRVVDAGTIGGLTADDLKGEKGDPGSAAIGKIIMSHGGGGWLANGFEAPSVFKRAGNAVIVGGGYAVMAMAGPTTMGNTAYGLASITYCIVGASASEYVSVVTVNDGTAEAPPDRQDLTVRDTDGCYTIPIGLAGGAFTIAVRIEGSGLRIGEVESVWLPVDEL